MKNKTNNSIVAMVNYLDSEGYIVTSLDVDNGFISVNKDNKDCTFTFRELQARCTG